MVTESAEEADLIRNWFCSTRHRYQVCRTEDGVKVFLASLLQDLVWEDLTQGIDATHQTLSGTIAASEAERSHECWVSLTSAIQDYGFMPLGLQKAFVYCATSGVFQGYTVALYEGGVIIPLLAKDFRGLAEIVERMLSDQRLPKPIAYERSLDGGNRCVVRVPDRGDSYLLSRQGEHLVPMSSFQSWLTPSKVVHVQRGGWACSPLIAVDPIAEWDEPPAEIIEVAADTSFESPTRDRIKDSIDRIIETYKTHPSPSAIIKSWSEFAQRARNLFSREMLAETATLALTNVSLDDTETIIEWVESKACRRRLRERVQAASPLKEEEVSLREKQVRRVRDNYPELSQLSDTAMAWCWQQYIQDTEDDSEQAGLLQEQRIDRCGRDPDFIVHILSRAIDQYRSQGELVHDSGGPMVKTMEGLSINIEAKAWFNGVAAILQILMEGQIEEDYLQDLLEDWRDHYHRVMRAGRQLNALQNATESLEQGPVLGSEWDKKYCRYAQPDTDLRVPRQLMGQVIDKES